MAQPEVEAAVKAHIEASGFANSAGLDVFYTNQLFETPSGTEWMLVQYPGSSNDNTDLATERRRELGGVRFVMHFHRGQGTDRPSQVARQLGDLFYRKTIAPGVKTLTPESPFYDDSNDSGFLFVVTVVVPYTFDWSQIP